MAGEEEERRMGGGVRKWFVSSQAVMSMLTVQLIATGMQLLSKVILSDGMFVFALMTYRHIVAALCMAPFAFFFERGVKNKLSWWVFFWLFLNSLAGILLAMGLFYYGLRDTTATYAVNFLNLIPIVTFVFSSILRIEKLGLDTRAGKMKTAGAILCVAGALTTSLYKGKAFYILHNKASHHNSAVKVSEAHWARGSFILVGSCLSYSAWYMLQVKLLKLFPLKCWATMLTCIIATMQSAVVGLCFDRSKAAWKLGWNLQLVTIIYSGAFATAATFCLVSWAVAKRGPIYPPMFNPLTLIFVAILEALILGAEISVGTLLGMVMITVGLYSFLLGKRKEMKKLTQTTESAGVEQEAIVIATTPTNSITDAEIGPHKDTAKP